MFLLDEHMLENLLNQLIRWHFPAKKIGRGIGIKGMDDKNQVIPLLHLLSKTTFFTHDLGFYKRKFCHPRYCIVVLSVDRYDAATYIRRFLKHPDLTLIRSVLAGLSRSIKPASGDCLLAKEVRANLHGENGLTG